MKKPHITIITPAQLEANRRNAQLSTGPRTESGKTASSQNARTHGLTSRRLLLQAENEQEYRDLRDGYFADLKPQGPIEESLVNHMVVAEWRMRRALEVEADFLNQSDVSNGMPSAVADIRTLVQIANLHARFERTWYRAKKELAVLQAERRNRESEARLAAESTRPEATITDSAKRSQPPAESVVRPPSSPIVPPPAHTGTPAFSSAPGI